MYKIPASLRSDFSDCRFASDQVPICFGIAADFSGIRSQKISNGKKKGKGNTKNGNKYLSWAFVEAANFAIRFSARIKSFYQRKKAKSQSVVALKAVAHKLCRACYYIMKNRVAFDVTKAFA